MIKSFKEVFNITNKYIMLATPLILYSLVSSVYLAASATGRVLNILIAVLLFLLMTGAFIAGWFNMVKLAVSYPDSREPNTIIKEFTAGVGEYFLPSLGVLFNILLITLLIIPVSIHYHRQAPL